MKYSTNFKVAVIFKSILVALKIFKFRFVF